VPLLGYLLVSIYDSGISPWPELTCDIAHMAAARSLAQVMADNKIALVYGGGTVGLMGEVARTLVSLSGPEAVHGIIPAPLIKHERGMYPSFLLTIPRASVSSPDFLLNTMSYVLYILISRFRSCEQTHHQGPAP
jgi:predicted Rossmann-fold nucleotide-binding protein